MLNNPVFDILKTFEKQELKSLDSFLASPFFNKKQEIIDLYRYIVKYAPEFSNEKKLSKAVISRKLFPGKRFDPEKIQRTISTFTKLVEQFIIQNEIQNNKVSQSFNLLEFYEKKSLYEHYNKAQKQLENILKKNGQNNESDYLNKYLLSLGKLNNYSINNQTERYEELNQTIKYFQIYCLFGNLKLLCHFFNNKTIIKLDEDAQLVDLILAQSQLEKFKENTHIKAFYNALMFIKDQDNEDNFLELKSMLQVGDQIKDQYDEKLLYDFSLNYCALRINAGHQNYYNEIFQLYQAALKTPFFCIDNYIFPNTIKNIITTGLRLGELEWIEQFLVEYKDKIHPDHREDVYNYNFAHLLFYKKEYDKALDYLSNVSYTDTFFKTDAKKLTAMIYYEQDEVRLLYSFVERFYMSNYRNNMVSERHIMSNRNFITILKQLINVTPGDTDKLEKLLQKIDEAEALADRFWIREKVLEKLGKKR